MSRLAPESIDEKLVEEESAEEEILLAGFEGHDPMRPLFRAILRMHKDERLCVTVCTRLHESDGFVGARIDDMLAAPYVDGVITCTDPLEYRLDVDAPVHANLSRSYKDEEVPDHLLGYFHKQLLRPREAPESDTEEDEESKGMVEDGEDGEDAGSRVDDQVVDEEPRAAVPSQR